VEPSLGHVDEVTRIREIILGMGFMTYKGSQYLIYGCLCRECATPSFSMQPFSKPFYSLLSF